MNTKKICEKFIQKLIDRHGNLPVTMGIFYGEYDSPHQEIWEDRLDGTVDDLEIVTIKKYLRNNKEDKEAFAELSQDGYMVVAHGDNPIYIPEYDKEDISLLYNNGEEKYIDIEEDARIYSVIDIEEAVTLAVEELGVDDFCSSSVEYDFTSDNIDDWYLRLENYYYIGEMEDRLPCFLHARNLYCNVSMWEIGNHLEETCGYDQPLEDNDDFKKLAKILGDDFIGSYIWGYGESDTYESYFANKNTSSYGVFYECNDKDFKQNPILVKKIKAMPKQKRKI